MIKNKETSICLEGLRNIDSTSIIDTERMNSKQLTRLWERGLQLISEGKIACVFNATELREDSYMTKPLCLTEIEYSGTKMTLLQAAIHRIEYLGKLAVEKFGKKYSNNRSPILLLIETSEISSDQITSVLSKNKYFGYLGIISYTTVIYRLT